MTNENEKVVVEISEAAIPNGLRDLESKIRVLSDRLTPIMVQPFEGSTIVDEKSTNSSVLDSITLMLELVDDMVSRLQF